MKVHTANLFTGLPLVILAAFFWGVGGGIAGLLLDKGWSPLVIAAFRAFIGLLFIIFWYLSHKKVKLTLNRSLIFWSVVAGCGMAGNIGFYFISITETNIPIASTLMYTAPVFVLIISALFRIEIITKIKLGATIVVITGIVLLTGVYNMSFLNISTWGIMSGLLSGLSYAIFIFGYKYSSAFGNYITVLMVSAFTELILLFSFSEKLQFLQVVTHLKDFVFFLLLGFVGAGLALFFYVVGLKKVMPGSASVVAMIEPVTASSFGIFILGQFINEVQFIGMIIILMTVTFLSYYTIKE
ncbi:DMT family transporter [Alkalibacillus aidingensis]|uniref:DMT family transporter n=1 Tax=Alkalibacillus aidingensis TaxID=2747607 RepID=UPI0016606494|nr:DMT family transporter [Alkalibacillus aidingensis]